MQSFDAARNILAPEDLFIINLDGDILDGPKEGRPINELAIHSEAMRARGDGNAVFHYHPEIATNFKRANHASKLWRYYVGRGARSGIIPDEWAQRLTPAERA